MTVILRKQFKVQEARVNEWPGLGLSAFRLIRCADGYAASATWKEQLEHPIHRSWGDLWVTRPEKFAAQQAMLALLEKCGITWEAPIQWEESIAAAWWLDVSRIDPDHIWENLTAEQKRSAVHYGDSLWFASEDRRRKAEWSDLSREGIPTSSRPMEVRRVFHKPKIVTLPKKQRKELVVEEVL